jgi:hypothetical protein
VKARPEARRLCGITGCSRIAGSSSALRAVGEASAVTTPLRAQAASAHSPLSYRTSTIRNTDAWHEAFAVQPGQRLYLAPKARMRIQFTESLK